jgi:poly-gamma-glutamate capsule biosynthesis protein CapA/YwtB (metallophosphatase superfamily)
MKYLIAIALVLIGCTNCGNANNQTAPSKNIDTTETPIQKSDTISLIAVGDIMFGTNFPDQSHLPPNDGKDLLNPFTAILKDADITFGNAEGVFLDKGGVPKGFGGNVFCFRQPVRYAKYFTDNGFDLISVANNHVADFGEAGLQSTIATLQNLPLHFAGATKYPTTIFEVRGIKIGMAAFAPHKGCVEMNDMANAIATVKKLKKTCNIVIVSFHAGAEGRNATHVPKKTEIFFGQNRGDVYKFSHAMIDAGADVVLGHGPHVARAMELYNNKFIAYSLGNFCTYGMFSLDGACGIAPLLKIYVNEKGEFIKGNITSIQQLGEGGPVPDETHGAFNLIKSLSANDLPGNTLKFLGNGELGKQDE